MATVNWEKLYSSLEYIPSWYPAVPTPTNAMLDAYEARNRFMLPRSYREFIKLFGPGEIATIYTICAPRLCSDWQKVC